MLILKLAFRNLLRHKSRSLLCGLTIMGAFILFSISLGFSDGSYGSLIRMLTDTQSGHVQVHRQGYLERPSLFRHFQLSQEIKQQLNDHPQVQAWTTRIFSSVLVFGEKKSSIARLMAVDPDQESQVTRIREKVKAGKFLSDTTDVYNPILIGSHLQKLIQVKVGEEVAFIGQGADGSVANDLFTVVGIVGKGSDDVESRRVYLPLKNAQEFLSLGDRIHEVTIRLDHFNLARKEAESLRNILNNEALDVQPWQVVEEQFYKAMMADQQGNWISQGVIMLIVGLVILITVLMNAFERRHEFGVLLALGTPPGFIFRSIVLEMTLLSGLSVLVGSFFAYGLNWYYSVDGIKLETPLEYGGVVFNQMLSENSMSVLLIPAIFSICVTFLVALYPAIKSARAVPIEAIREN